MSLLSSFQVEKQKADDAISVVCDRLEHATLLQDRRAAVLSLKAFAREHKEAVVAGGLRGLLRSLSIDKEDEELLHATLDCLLSLFAQVDGATLDDTALWIADEFTLRPENIHNLLEIVTEQNYHIKLRTIEVLASVLECRITQLQECVMNSATGVSSLVAVLDDRREQIRNEGLLLLVKLVHNHVELQKRVVFENAYDKVFNIIHEEGGLEGGIVTSDCFILLHNLLSANVSNQNWFRETEFFKKITELVQSFDKGNSLGDLYGRNVKATLSLTRLFVSRSAKAKKINQDTFMKVGMTTQVVGLAFSVKLPQDIRADALCTLADLIHENATAQDYFIRALSIATDPLNNSKGDKNEVPALWELLLSGGQDSFAIASAAGNCLEALVSGHQDRKMTMLRLLKEQFLSFGETGLLSVVTNRVLSHNEHQIWFACCTLMHLTFEDEQARGLFTSLTIGDSSVGEEEVSLIQTLSANLVSALHEHRLQSSAAYLMLLSSWLFESRDNTADFLEEGSTLQALVLHCQAEDNNLVLRGLCAILLSIVYAFNFAECSPMTRSDLQAILLRLGREIIVDSINSFSRLEAVYSATTSSSFSVEHPLLDHVFVDFFRDHYGLIRKAIDQAPVPNRTRREEEELEEQERTEDIIADLEGELERKNSGLQEAVNIIKTRQEELQRLREENKYIQQRNDVEQSQFRKEIENLRIQKTQLLEEAKAGSNDIDKALRENAVLHSELVTLKGELDEARKNTALEASKAANFEHELQSESSKRSFLEKELVTLRQSSDINSQELSELRSHLQGLETELSSSKDIRVQLEQQVAVLSDEVNESRALAKKTQSELVSLRTKSRDLDTELRGVKQEHEAEKRLVEKEMAQFEENLKLKDSKLEEVSEDYRAVQEKLEQIRLEKDSLQAKLDVANKSLQEAATRPIVTDIPVDKGDDDTKHVELTSLRQREKEMVSLLESTQKERDDLKQQLEQAQEDLMLLMEDDSNVADEN